MTDIPFSPCEDSRRDAESRRSQSLQEQRARVNQSLTPPVNPRLWLDSQALPTNPVRPMVYTYSSLPAAIGTPA